MCFPYDTVISNLNFVTNLKRFIICNWKVDSYLTAWIKNYPFFNRNKSYFPFISSIILWKLVHPHGCLVSTLFWLFWLLVLLRFFYRTWFSWLYLYAHILIHRNSFKHVSKINLIIDGIMSTRDVRIVSCACWVPIRIIFSRLHPHSITYHLFGWLGSFTDYLDKSWAWCGFRIIGHPK